MASASLKNPTGFLFVFVGFCAMAPVALALGLVPRGYKDIDPRTMSCTIGFHQSTMIGAKLYIDGGFMWYKNGSNHVGPNMWLRVLDTSKKFTVDVVNEVPIEFISRPAEVVEVSAGDLWAYDGVLYQRPGFNEGADSNFPGWNGFPNGSVFDFWRYDIKANSWELFQHNPNTTSNVPIKRIRHAQSIMIKGLDQAFVISGEIVNDNTWANGMLIYDFKGQTWKHKDTKWDNWSMGVVNHLAFDDPSSGYILGFAGQAREEGRMDLIEIYDLKFSYWRNSQLATAADERNAVPEPRVKPCSVIARAKDGSSYNIYMFGGWSPDGSVGYGDMWVLSIPSFKWFLVNTGLSTTTGTPANYEAMTCYIVGEGSKMLVYGGRTRTTDYQAECDRTSIHVFDMTRLVWEEVYDPRGGEYEVPKEIYDVIGGGPHGGATLLPKGGMANSDIEATFKDIITKTKLNNGTTNTNTTSTSTGSNGSTATPDSTVKKGSKSKVSSEVIAGVVVGAFIGISLVFLGVWGLRKRSRARARRAGLPGSDGISPAEMSAALPPGELHSYGFAPHPQELHAYMPDEMASSRDEGLMRASYYQPVKPESRIRGAEVGRGESVQGQLYYAGSEGTLGSNGIPQAGAVL